MCPIRKSPNIILFISYFHPDKTYSVVLHAVKVSTVSNFNVGVAAADEAAADLVAMAVLEATTDATTSETGVRPVAETVD